jgi:uncharacterized protein YraI
MLVNSLETRRTDSMKTPSLLASLARCLIVASLLLPIPALAESVSITRAVNVRAGPDPSFPLVSWLQAGTVVQVVGCTDGWHWCDVASGRTRGWIHSRYLGNFFRNRTPVITFSVADYWDAHYQRRPWYSERSAWIDWGTPGFRPPPAPSRR